MTRLAELLDRRTRLAEVFRKEGDRIRCLACAHRCLLRPGQRGICKVRFHGGDGLRVPFGYVAGLAVDPVEKKPFFHFLPGSDVLTFGMLGCDFRCDYCQNWITSQALRDPAAGASIQATTPEQIVGAALRTGARAVVSSYNEPIITAEWAAAVFDASRRAGLPTAIVSNGHGTPEVLDYLQPRLTAVKIDLKTFDARRYRRLGGKLDAVLETIRSVHQRGLWLEIVTLVVPGFNDDPAELRDIASFLAGISPDIPWHVTAFHPDYQMTEPPRTRAEQLLRAAEIGEEAGLRFVYAGNLPGQLGDREDTRCPGCGATLIRRRGFHVLANRLGPEGRCPDCQRAIPGIWRRPSPDPATGGNRRDSPTSNQNG
ncbi:MAG: AmmeMemoRadiSam system radical SAM enzyme [Verrucomicrobia bacterium]|nr:MAG: AmmeMemoRadiSam system radical SAM enzyme [Verrucomicrobiota bacterium]